MKIQYQRNTFGEPSSQLTVLQRFDEVSAVFVAHSTTQQVLRGKVTHAEDKNTIGWDAQSSSMMRGVVLKHGHEADEFRSSISSTVRNFASGTSITIHASQHLFAVESHVTVQTTNVLNTLVPMRCRKW